MLFKINKSSFEQVATQFAKRSALKSSTNIVRTITQRKSSSPIFLLTRPKNGRTVEDLDTT